MKYTRPKKEATSGLNFNYRSAQMEKSYRNIATSFGGVSAIRQMVVNFQLDKEINNSVSVLKRRRGYAESDHVLAMAYNPLHGGQTLDDVERMRRDPAIRLMLDADSISDPTTLGDFCRRFDAETCDQLQEAVNRTRQKVWATQPDGFFSRATIDVDGVFVPTSSECSEGVEYSGHKRQWGYHPLVVSLAETSEPLFLVNRAGARPSHEDAHIYLDRAIELCQQSGFRQIVLRGDTDFSQTKYLDRWNSQPGVGFVFGMDCSSGLRARAEALEESAWQPLIRERREVDEDDERSQQPRLKEQLVIEKEYKNLELEGEDIAEIIYRPTACRQYYRLVIVRKNINVTQGGRPLFNDYRYHFYITNLTSLTAREVVREANDRCDQENLNSHLKRGVHALRAPLKTLESNWAYMIATALAWSFKAWFALTGKFDAPEPAGQRALSRRLLKMEFRTFLMEMICIPALVVESGRRLLIRTLSDPPWARHLRRAHSTWSG